jgi:predicted short-subunit dehydrogenase-like oxidoreductase (DUF2520 family)
LQGVPFALEGDREAVRRAGRIVRDLGGRPFKILEQNKPAYHALGSFASPLLIALLVEAEQVGRAAGLSRAESRKKILPLVRQTIENYERLGAAQAFSGPIVRGDLETVKKHLAVLRGVPGARDVYIVLANAALEHLGSPNRNRLRRLLME